VVTNSQLLVTEVLPKVLPSEKNFRYLFTAVEK
jgi:hypothetical protein